LEDIQQKALGKELSGGEKRLDSRMHSTAAFTTCVRSWKQYGFDFSYLWAAPGSLHLGSRGVQPNQLISPPFIFEIQQYQTSIA